MHREISILDFERLLNLDRTLHGVYHTSKLG
jgi:hypothetical protein